MTPTPELIMAVAVTLLGAVALGTDWARDRDCGAITQEGRMDIVEITVRARVGQGHHNNAYTTLEERFEVRPALLEDVLAVLNRFHELAERIRDEQAGIIK